MARNVLRKNSKIIVIFLDQIIIYASFLLAFLLRFDFQWSSIPKQFSQNLLSFAPILSIVTALFYFAFGSYNIVWRFIDVKDVARVIMAGLLSAISTIIIGFVINNRQPTSVLIMAWTSIIILTCLVRLLPRFFVSLGMLGAEPRMVDPIVYKERAMIIGAGQAGEMTVQDLRRNAQLGIKPVLIVDDNTALTNRTIAGVPVLGTTKDIVPLAEEHDIDIIIFAIPSLGKKRKKEILEICNQTSCQLKMITSYIDMVTENQASMALRDVTIEDLLEREPIKTNLEEVGQYIRDKVVMVTGAGGSIGSELCRQVCKLHPKQIILIDIYENSLYATQLELLEKHPELEIITLIASVRDIRRMESIFQTYKPQVIYHAAAHKHVPLMEDSPMEAIKNNIGGTYKMAKLADKYYVERFVQISTDKAVHPTNIMGATKRVCEMIIQTIGKDSATRFVAVRFGNVLGSNGSVVPIFKKQIEAGGPVTVTHPDIIRYFMTIPEAVSLVMQAGAYASPGEIYVLDMGEPVKIDDLARKMIRLSGNVPNKDISIVYTGLRPGEKLYEEMLLSEEGLRKTPSDLIYIANPLNIDRVSFEQKVTKLISEAENNSDTMLSSLMELVPINRYNKSQL
jgi:FlaA1/EpsC-like NDP-sugar epimerase